MAKRIQSVTADAKVTLCTAQATAFAGVLPTPAQLAVVPDNWTSATRAVVPEFDLEIDAAGALDLAALELLAGMQTTGVVAADAVDVVDFANDELDITAHGYSTGDLIPGITTATTLPAGLELSTPYYVIYVNSGTIQLASSLANALAGVAVPFTDAGTGTHTLGAVATVIKWFSVGLIGPDGTSPGTVSLTLRKGYTARAKHSAHVVAYSLAGTISASTASARLSPVVES